MHIEKKFRLNGTGWCNNATMSPRDIIRAIRLHPAQAATAVLVAVGVVLRLISYFGNRPFWLDEASLALCIVESSFGQLATPLNHYQTAPLGFLFLSKAIVSTAGTSELAFRFVPLASSLIALAVFPFLAAKCLRPAAVPFAVAFMVFFSPLIYYSQEFKQYSSDVLASILLYIAALQLMESQDRLKPGLVVYVATTIFCALLSFPSLFVSFAITITLAIVFLKARQWVKLTFVALSAAAHAGCFKLMFDCSLKDIPWPAAEAFRQWWRSHDGFVPPIKQWQDLSWFGEALLRPIRYFTLRHEPELPVKTISTFALAFTGIFQIKPIALIMLLLPVVPLAVASSFEIYPCNGRFILFLAPQLALLAGSGLFAVAALLFRIRPVLALAAVALILWAIVDRRLLQLVPQKENMKPVLTYIKERKQPNDMIFVYQNAGNLARFYARLIDLDELLDCRQEQPTIEHLRKIAPGRRVWVIQSHWTNKDDVIAPLRESKLAVDQAGALNIEAVLVDLTGTENED